MQKGMSNSVWFALVSALFSLGAGANAGAVTEPSRAETSAETEPASPAAETVRLSDLLPARNTQTGLDFESAAKLTHYRESAQEFVRYRQAPESRAGVEYRRKCEEDPHASALCPVAVDLTALPVSPPDATVRGVYVQGIRAIEAPARREAACRIWAPRLRTALDAANSSLLRPALLYWLAKCAEAGRNATLATEWIDRIWREYPLSLHARELLKQTRDVRLTTVIAREVNPSIEFRSVVRPDLNEVIAGVEALLALENVSSAGVALQRLARIGAVPDEFGAPALEPEVRLYLVALARRIGARLSSVALVNEILRPLLRDQPDWIARTTLQLLYPIDFEAVMGETRFSVSGLVAEAVARASGGPDLARTMLALIHRESGYDPRAKSRADALGLVQILLPVAREQMARWPRSERESAFPARLEERDVFEPRLNVRLGVENLKSRIDLFDKNVAFALAGYHAGNRAVQNWLNQGPTPQAPNTIKGSLVGDRMAQIDLVLMTPERETSTARYAAAVLAHSEWYGDLYPNWPRR